MGSITCDQLYHWGQNLIANKCYVPENEMILFMEQFNMPRVETTYKSDNQTVILNTCVLAHRLRQPTEVLWAYMNAFLHTDGVINNKEQIQFPRFHLRRIIETALISFICEYIICGKCYYPGMIAFVVKAVAITRCPNCPNSKPIANIQIVNYYLKRGISCDDMDPSNAPIKVHEQSKRTAHSYVFGEYVYGDLKLDHRSECMCAMWQTYKTSECMINFIYRMYDVIKTHTHNDGAKQKMLLHDMWYINFRDAINEEFIEALYALYDLHLVDANYIIYWCIRQCRISESLLKFMPDLMAKFTMTNTDYIESKVHCI